MKLLKTFWFKKALGPIEEMYAQLGFPKFHINIRVDNTASQEKK